jgi:glycosyltransferase involved in cell wall biosynthesis
VPYVAAGLAGRTRRPDPALARPGQTHVETGTTVNGALSTRRLRRSTAPRVVHISPVAFGDSGMVGGGERYPAELARAMAALTPTTLVTFGRQADRQRVGDLDLRVLATRGRYKGHELNPLSEQLAGAIARADVVHVHQWESVTGNLAVLAARGLHRRVFATDHGGSAPNHWRRLRLDRLLHGMLCVSEFAAGFYPELAGRTRTIYGGVDTEWYRPTDVELASMSDPSTQVRDRRGSHALFVGRLMPHKGVDVLIEALDRDTELRVLGRPYDPAFLHHLRGLAARKRVTFICDADDTRLRHEYRIARAVVLPSLLHPRIGPPAPKSELLGLTLLEAMASGTPTICTRTGGMPEVVADGVSGIVVEPHDALGLTAAITALTRPNRAWAAMAAAARARAVENFTWRAVAQRCLGCYADLATVAVPPSRQRQQVAGVSA